MVPGNVMLEPSGAMDLSKGPSWARPMKTSQPEEESAIETATDASSSLFEEDAHQAHIARAYIGTVEFDIRVFKREWSEIPLY